MCSAWHTLVLQQPRWPSLHLKVVVEPMSSHSYILQFALQIEKLQQQVSQAVAGRRTAEAEALRRGATLKQLEHRLGELSSENDVSNPSASACMICTVMCCPAQRRPAEPHASQIYISTSLGQACIQPFAIAICTAEPSRLSVGT